MLFRSVCGNIEKTEEKKELSQIQLGNLMFVNHPTVARWESGLRLPDAAMITRLAKVLGVEVGALLTTEADSDESPAGERPYAA